MQLAVPMRVDGETFRLERTGGLMTKAAEPVVPARLAEIDAVTTSGTATVLIGNVMDDFPAGMDTLAETVAAALLLANLTTAPPVGATPVRVTVPVEERPPTTVPGVNVTD